MPFLNLCCQLLFQFLQSFKILVDEESVWVFLSSAGLEHSEEMETDDMFEATELLSVSLLESDDGFDHTDSEDKSTSLGWVLSPIYGDGSSSHAFGCNGSVTGRQNVLAEG